jgi:hypothetical protein
MSATSEFSKVSAILYKRGQSLLNLLLGLMKVSYLVIIQTLAHTMFSMSPPIVLKQRVIRCLMRLMALKKSKLILILYLMRKPHVMPQDPSNQAQETFPNNTTPPAKGLDQDNHEENVEPNSQGQEESNDQMGDKDDGDKEEAPPHPRVHQNVQRDHPVDNILGDIEKDLRWTKQSQRGNLH